MLLHLSEAVNIAVIVVHTTHENGVGLSRRNLDISHTCWEILFWWGTSTSILLKARTYCCFARRIDMIHDQLLHLQHATLMRFPINFLQKRNETVAEILDLRVELFPPFYDRQSSIQHLIFFLSLSYFGQLICLSAHLSLLCRRVSIIHRDT